MNRRELLKRAPAVGLMAVAAVPLARAACTQPSGSTVQTINPTSYTVSATDVSNGYADISATWPSSFSGSYVVVGDYSYLKASGTHNLGSLNCTYMGGITGVSSTGVSIIVVFNPNATNKVASGDVIDVNFIGIGTVA